MDFVGTIEMQEIIIYEKKFKNNLTLKFYLFRFSVLLKI